MREYGRIFISFWTSANMRGLSSDARALGAYLLTGPHTTALGCFRCPVGYVSDDLEIPPERVRKAFHDLCETKNGPFIYYDFDAGWVLIPKFLKWEPPQNPNMGKNIAGLFENVPDYIQCYKHLVYSLREYGRHLPPETINRLKTLSNGFANQDQDQDQEVREDPPEKPASKPPATRKVSDEDMAIATWIFETIRDRHAPDIKKPNLTAWANDVRLMRERDGRAPEHIRALFEWATGHHFWHGNILSPASLRKQWTKLAVQRKNEREEGKSGGRKKQQDGRSARERAQASFQGDHQNGGERTVDGETIRDGSDDNPAGHD